MPIDEIVLPTVEAIASTRAYGRFQIAPLETGMGVVLSTALRRVLLSSLPGAAITSLHIAGI